MTKLEKIYELIQKYNPNIRCSLYGSREIAIYWGDVESHDLTIQDQGRDICVFNNDGYAEGMLDDFIAKFDGELDRVNNYLSSYDDFKNVDEIFECISQEIDKDNIGYSRLADELQDYVERYYGYQVEYGALLIDTLNDDYTKYKYDAAYEAIKDIQEIFSPCKKELLDILNEKDIDESFIYEKLEDNDKLKLQDMSTKDATHITVKRYKDNEQLFDIKQETDEDDLHFYVRIDNGKETFEYSRKIETQQDFVKALEQTINALENYNEFNSYRDDLIDVLDKFK